MLEDRQRKRMLFPDGTSVVSLETYTKMLISEKPIPDSVKVVDSYDSDMYKLFFGKDVAVYDDFDPVLEASAHEHTPEDLERLLDAIKSSSRYDGTDIQLERLERELGFFERTHNICFLLEVCKLLDRFRVNGVVWGVGRGSACSSLLLYLIGLHDVDPIFYDIKFSELTKDADDD